MPTDEYGAYEQGFEDGRESMMGDLENLLREMFESPHDYIQSQILGASTIVNTMNMRLQEEQA